MACLKCWLTCIGGWDERITLDLPLKKNRRGGGWSDWWRGRKKKSTCFLGTFGFLISFVIFFLFFRRNLLDMDTLSPSLDHCDFYLSPWPSVNFQHPVRRLDEDVCVCACMCVCVTVKQLLILKGPKQWQWANYTLWVSAVNASQA